MKTYTAAEQKQIEIFGHVLPQAGGSYTFSHAEGLQKVPDPDLDLESQPGMIKQPTAITAADVAADRATAAKPAQIPGAAPKV